jgi:Fe-S-cluster-containing hydrogenase component 2/thioredoxin reductase/CRP-like cAMP-binding protein
VADIYHIAIIGSGPAGLSAAGRAAYHDQQRGGGAAPSYVLLEGYSAPAKTIQRYQKGKHVMAEPGYLDLRSDFEFAEGTREHILQRWADGLVNSKVNIRFDAEVSKITGQRGAFAISLGNGETITAENVVLAIGLEGNPRRLGVKGDELPGVEYHLEDPEAFRDETIIVVGAGDSAIENALALARQNDVYIVNRRDEFSRAKDGNLALILAASSDPNSRLKCLYKTQPKEVRSGQRTRLVVTLETPTGPMEIHAHRIIARLGAVPPRSFVEGAGVAFPSAKSEAIPELSAEYESNVKGLYIVGSLAGYPLIKQAMNQGYDVVEFIHGNHIRPADHPLLEYQFAGLPFERDVDELMELLQKRIPMFRELNALTFRELIIESNLIASYAPGPAMADAQSKMRALQPTLEARKPSPRSTRIIREGEEIYRAGDFGTSFFTIAAGEIVLEVPGTPPRVTQLSQGQFFGEMSLLSGRPRLETAKAGPNCILVETPRRTMLKLMNSNDEVRLGIDWIFVVRELQRQFAPNAKVSDLRAIAANTVLHQYKAGEVVFTEGERGDSLHLIRSGGVGLNRKSSRGSVLIAQVRSGQPVGEMALMGDPIRRETATALVALETIEVKRPEFLALVELGGSHFEQLQRDTSRRAVENAVMEMRPETGAIMDFLMREGLGEATNVLIIDEALCIGCDNCEKACAETHAGLSRLDRKAGNSFAQIHVPTACRHCEQPHCMKDCPPNAIHRSTDGEVFIDQSCIGCGNCQVNCPYGVIKLAYEPPPKPGLFAWMLFGRGSGPGEEADYTPTRASGEKGKKAVKCDACVEVANGPACVKACPTGAALRIGPEQFIDLVADRRA